MEITKVNVDDAKEESVVSFINSPPYVLLSLLSPKIQMRLVRLVRSSTFRNHEYSVTLLSIPPPHIYQVPYTMDTEVHFRNIIKIICFSKIKSTQMSFPTFMHPNNTVAKPPALFFKLEKPTLWCILDYPGGARNLCKTQKWVFQV